MCRIAKDISTASLDTFASDMIITFKYYTFLFQGAYARGQ
jgi:hypothetical protein